jgi:arabinose-5-phosphate isomerase
MIKALLQQQKESLAHYFDTLDCVRVEKVIEACAEVRGLIVFTGVGKSGIIAEKIAATLISTGTKALYLPSTNFLHGDIGILSDQDMLVLISRSGETEELLNLVPFAKKRNTFLLSVVSNGASRLAKMSDLSIELPCQKELCPFDLAPTTSTEVQLLFGDLLAIALMERKEFSLDAYAQNHPLGAIGKKIVVTVDALMSRGKDVPLARPSDRLVDALVELSQKKCGALLVADEEDRFLGIFTDGDLRRALQSQGASVLERPLHELMTVSAQAVEAGSLAWDALKIMQKDPKKFIMVLPVLNQGKVAGILRMHDIVQAGIG